MKPIKILYWSQLSFDNNVFNPVFFFTPTLEILPIIQQYNYLNIPIIIQNTNGIYDGFYYVKIDKSTSLGNCPSDNDKIPPIYSVSLNCPFTMYPYKSFIGEFFIANNNQEIIDNVNPQLIRDQIEIDKESKYNLNQLKNNFNIDAIENYEYFEPTNDTETPDDTESETESEIDYPKDCSINKKSSYIYIIISCVFLLLIIILILCFYGDLRKK